MIGPPKSSAGVRDVAIPPHLLGELAAHLAAHCGPGRDALLFTTPRGAQLYHSVLYREWNAAREATGLPGFHFHDLRHTGMTWLARDGATLKERMHRAGCVRSEDGGAVRARRRRAGRGERRAALPPRAGRGAAGPRRARTSA